MDYIQNYVLVGLVTGISIGAFYLGQLYHDWGKITSTSNNMNQMMMEGMSMWTDMFSNLMPSSSAGSSGTVGSSASLAEIPVHPETTVEVDSDDDELKQVVELKANPTADKMENPLLAMMEQMGPMMKQLEPMMKSVSSEVGNIFQEAKED